MLPLGSFRELDGVWFHTLRQPIAAPVLRDPAASTQRDSEGQSLSSSVVVLVPPGYWRANGRGTPFPWCQTIFPGANRSVVPRLGAGVCVPGRGPAVAQNTRWQTLGLHRR